MIGRHQGAASAAPIVGQEFNPHRFFRNRGAFIPEPLLTYPNLSMEAKLIWGRLSGLAGCSADGKPHISRKTLAAEFGVSEAKIKRLFAELVTGGFLRREERGQGRTAKSVFLFHPCFDGSPVSHLAGSPVSHQEAISEGVMGQNAGGDGSKREGCWVTGEPSQLRMRRNSEMESLDGSSSSVVACAREPEATTTNAIEDPPAEAAAGENARWWETPAAIDNARNALAGLVSGHDGGQMLPPREILGRFLRDGKFESREDLDAYAIDLGRRAPKIRSWGFFPTDAASWPDKREARRKLQAAASTATVAVVTIDSRDHAARVRDLLDRANQCEPLGGAFVSDPAHSELQKPDPPPQRAPACPRCADAGMVLVERSRLSWCSCAAAEAARSSKPSFVEDHNARMDRQEAREAAAAAARALPKTVTPARACATAPPLGPSGGTTASG